MISREHLVAQLGDLAVNLVEPMVDLGKLTPKELDELLVLGGGHGPCLPQIHAPRKCVQLWTALPGPFRPTGARPSEPGPNSHHMTGRYSILAGLSLKTLMSEALLDLFNPGLERGDVPLQFGEVALEDLARASRGAAR